MEDINNLGAAWPSPIYMLSAVPKRNMYSVPTISSEPPPNLASSRLVWDKNLSQYVNYVYETRPSPVFVSPSVLGSSVSCFRPI